MSKAAEKELNALHGKVAVTMAKYLEAGETASLLLAEFGGDENFPKPVRKFLEEFIDVSPAMLTVITRFLKDNEITADAEKDNSMNALEQALANRKRLSDIPAEPYDA